ncbi:MAG: class I SAM-dependent methyltransferase [Candidatus Pacebacteria bacterium]|nr:class I SAM-dependent methyltransferase [Candidatus Paceibacterota bacterium]
MEKVRCPICNNHKFTHILIGQDNINKIQGKFNIVKCTGCHLLLTNPRPNLIEIKKYYPIKYIPYHPDFKKSVTIANFRLKYPLIYSIIDPQHNINLLTHKKINNILEIGCGAGNYLYELKTLYPNWNISGVDISETNINYLKKNNINAYLSNLTNIPHKDSSLDIVYGWMVLEHVHELNKAILEIHRVLKNNGIFCLSVPNAASWEFKLFKENWHGLHLPNHLYHFTPKSITMLLEKNNFYVKKIIFQKNFSSVFSSLSVSIENSSSPKFIKKISRKVLKWNIFYHLVTLPFSYLLSFLKQSGRITIIAYKK